MEIVKYGDVAKEALIEIKKFQTGELGVVTLGRPWKTTNAFEFQPPP